ncbi:MAG TPA: copper resistance CopC family protein [Stellaceae bacterium]|nr:copper resistance CopC family protein [Stellaceae bacterium]
MQRRSASGLAALLLAAALGLPPVPAAQAHAIVVAAAPGPGEQVKGPDVPVALRFNSRIDRERSRLSLLRSSGKPEIVPLAASAPDTLAGKLQDLSPGSYRLRWQVLGVDGHITRGDIPFAVIP